MVSIKRRLKRLEDYAKRQNENGDKLAIMIARGKAPEEVERELEELRAQLAPDAVIIILDELDETEGELQCQ